MKEGTSSSLSETLAFQGASLRCHYIMKALEVQLLPDFPL